MPSHALNRYDLWEAIAEALGSLGDMRAVRPLLALDTSQYSPDAVEAALDRLAAVSTDLFVAALDHPPYAYKAAYTLKRLAEQRATPEVKNLLIPLLRHQDKSVRRTAAEGLHGHPPALEPLMVALKDEDGGVRWNAAEALGTIGDLRAVESLVVALRDPDHLVRSHAAEALGTIGDLSAIESLVVALRDPDHLVRLRATGALKAIRDPRAVPPLVEALYDPDPDVGISAAEALAVLSNRQAVKPLISFVVLDSDQLRSRWDKAVARLPQRSEEQYYAETCGHIMSFPVDFIDVRIAAAKALAQLGAPPELDTLVVTLGKVIPSTQYGIKEVNELTHAHHAGKNL